MKKKKNFKDLRRTLLLSHCQMEQTMGIHKVVGHFHTVFTILLYHCFAQPLKHKEQEEGRCVEGIKLFISEGHI